MTAVIFYLLTRSAMAAVALISIDALAETTLAGEPSHVAAVFALIAIAEITFEDSQ
jgi:hypothetical protein